MNDNRAADAQLAAVIDKLSQPARLFQPHRDGRIRCTACGHRCLLGSNDRGKCLVRYTNAGTLMAPYGYVAGLHDDPIEKKPFYHFLPGASALTFGMLGCSGHCPFCQNWLTSQTLRDKQAGAPPTGITAEQVVATATDCGSGAVVSSYNEPLITAEWAYDIFSLAQQAGLKTALVSNGHGTPQALEFLRPVTDAIKIDLKSMSRAGYRELGLSLKVVLDTLERAWRLGFWVEVVTLVVPGFNDTADELAEIAAFVAGVSPQIPWHVSAFHPDYRYTEAPPTPVDTLLQAGELGRAAGLEYVYAGNVDALLPDMVNTTCPGCSAELIRRVGYYILDNQINEGRCPSCSREIPGIWS